jgi:hypothetical protein
MAGGLKAKPFLLTKLVGEALINSLIPTVSF